MSTFTQTISILCLLFVLSGSCIAQTTDTTVTDSTDAKKPKIVTAHQLVLNVDLWHPVQSMLTTGQKGYEFSADYYLDNERYLVAEGGFGSATVNYTDLQYSTTNKFLKFGFNKVLLNREGPTDWGGMLLGMRLGWAGITRSAGSYVVTDTLWGNSTGTVPSKNFNGYWVEILGGVRLELGKGIMAGWTIRGKFLLNSKQFSDLAPIYVAGYGRGDKNAIFDFNLYLGYAIRWKRKGVGN